KMRLVEKLGIEVEVAGESLAIAAYDYVVEATGSSAGLERAVAMTRPRGTLVLKSTVHDRVSVDTAAVIVNGITLFGSRCGGFGPALDLLSEGAMILEPLIHARFALRDAPQAFARAAEKGARKVLLNG